MTEQVKMKIIALVGISEVDYNVLVWKLGLQYAYHYTDNDDEAVRFMTKTASFWQWWKNQWMLVDQRFLLGYSRYQSAAATNAMYDFWVSEHQPASLAVFPGKLVLEDTYSMMMSKAIDELHKSKLGGVL